MKTPTTITVIAWNYCQNSCSYCVSKSNTERWKLNNKKEVWKPSGDEHLNYYELCEKYGFKFHDKMCPDPAAYLDANDVIDFDYVIKWIKKYRPDAHVHISGGEPLLRPDIEEVIKKVSSEFETTIVTNGQLISTRLKLLEFPVKWLVTWHRTQISLNKFMKQIQLIKDKPHLITCIMQKDEDIYQYNDIFNEFNFEYKYNVFETIDSSFKYNKEDLEDIASHRIMLIQPNGPVMGCNKIQYGDFERYKSESNIYTMVCDEFQLSVNNIRAKVCVENNRCSAYQTAVKMAKISVDR